MILRRNSRAADIQQSSRRHGKLHSKDRAVSVTKRKKEEEEEEGKKKKGPYASATHYKPKRSGSSMDHLISSMFAGRPVPYSYVPGSAIPDNPESYPHRGHDLAPAVPCVGLQTSDTHAETSLIKSRLESTSGGESCLPVCRNTV